MVINFYLNNEKKTLITSFLDLKTNPFSIGDVINLNVRSLTECDLKPYKEKTKKDLIEGSKELENLFKMKEVKIVREEKYMDLKFLSDTKLSINYYCDILS